MVTNVEQAVTLAGQWLAQGRTAECRDICQRELAERPDNVDALDLMGLVERRDGHVAEAESLFRLATLTGKDHALAWLHLGQLLFETVASRPAGEDTDESKAAGGAHARLSEAVTCLQNAVAHGARQADAYYPMGMALQRLGRLDEAVAAYRMAVKLAPEHAAAHANLGIVLAAQKNLAEAAQCARRAIELQPNLATLHINLGAILLAADQPDAAIEATRAAIQLMPNLPAAHNNLGTALKETGSLGGALASFRRAREIQDNYATAHSNEIYTLHFHPAYNAAAILAAHRDWNDRHARPLARHMRSWKLDRDPDRTLRVGLVSPDFRQHVVGHFLQTLFEHHDPGQIELIAYSDVVTPDAATRRFARTADSWRDIHARGDKHVDALIREDRIDILVDLTMHMSRNRLLVFARKPAPVAVTYLAYCSTTGVTAIDYRLSDSFLDPPGATDADYSERTERLRTYWCYEPPAEALPVNEPPVLSRGHVTFGCLNNYCKISTAAWEAWAAILSRVPTARLMVHSPLGRHRQGVLSQFSRLGVDPSRVQFVGRSSPREYFRRYHEIDIALDPFPYAGGTTTCDALWMGVPVVTLCGATAVGRGGVTILGQLGLSDWVSRSVPLYVDRACRWAENPDALVNWRDQLRGRMLDSPLMEGRAFARDFQRVMRSMWRTWCGGGQPPALSTPAA